MRILLLVLTFFYLCPLIGQEDPYLKKSGYYNANKKYTINDSTVVIRLNELAKDSAYSNPQKSFQYADFAKQIAQKIEYPEGKVEALIGLSRAKINQNDLDSAMRLADQAYQLARKLNNDLLVVLSKDMKGSIYSYKGDYDKAVDQFFEAASLAEQIHEKYALTSYTNIGHIYRKTGNIPKAIEYTTKSLKLGTKYGDTAVMINAHNLLGLIDKSNHDPEGALNHFEAGLELARETNNLKRQAELLYNMSHIYFAQQDYVNYDKFFNESMAISKSNGSYRSIAVGYHSKSIKDISQGDNVNAAMSADSALKYAKLTKNYELIMETYALEAEVHKLTDELKDALGYLSLAYIYKDSMNLAQINSAISESEGKYETEKRELKAEMERAQDQKINAEKLWWRDLLLWISGLIVAVVTIGIYMLFRSNKQIKLKNQTVEQQKEEIEYQHEEIKDSIQYAKRIQSALIGNEAEWRKLSKHVSIFFAPRDVVSGDFYWVYNNLEKNYSVWAVADCTGHGVPGAFMSMLGIGFLNELIIDNGMTDPGEILDRLRSKIIAALESEQNESNDGMDISLCVWDKNSNTLKFAGANNGLWIIRNAEEIESDKFKSVHSVPDTGLSLLELAPDKMPIGHYFTIPPPFTTKEIHLMKNDMVVLYTDGFADQFGGDHDKKFKYRQLKELLISLKSKDELNVEKELTKAFNDWKGNRPQTDDVCIVSISVDMDS